MVAWLSSRIIASKESDKSTPKFMALRVLVGLPQVLWRTILIRIDVLRITKINPTLKTFLSCFHSHSCVKFYSLEEALVFEAAVMEPNAVNDSAIEHATNSSGRGKLERCWNWQRNLCSSTSYSRNSAMPHGIELILCLCDTAASFVDLTRESQPMFVASHQRWLCLQTRGQQQQGARDESTSASTSTIAPFTP